MSKSPSSVRLWTTVAILLGAFVLLQTVSHGEAVAPRQPLDGLPYTLGPWTGRADSLQQEVVKAVGVSDYANRVYSQPGVTPIQLYIGFYTTQRSGDTIHSPKNCLPGAGWDPIRSGYATVPVADGRKIVVNEYVIQQDQDKQLVFYWYQGRGRVIASEYAGKLWMVVDALSRNRTDSALVRLVTPMADSEGQAHARLVKFTQVLFPHLDEFIPN